MEIKEMPVDPGLLDHLLDTHIDLPPVVSTAEIRFKNRIIGKLMLDPDAVDRLTYEQQSESVRDRAIGPALRRDAYYRLFGALDTDVRFLLAKYLELLNVGEFNDLLCGWTPSVLELLEELPREKVGPAVQVPMVAWSLEHMATHGSPQQKRRVANIRRTAVPDGRGAPIKEGHDHADVKIAKQVREAERLLKVPFDQCAEWRKGGYTNCKEFMTGELAKQGYDKAVIRAVVSSRNVFTAASRFVALKSPKKVDHRTVAEMARRGKNASTSQRQSKHR